MNFFLGIDVGGTRIKYGIFDENLHPVSSASMATPNSRESLLESLKNIEATAMQSFRIRSAAIGIPGFIQKKDKVIVRSPNMDFLNGICLQKQAESVFSIPVKVENDANTAALGAYDLLSPPLPQTFVHLTLGTGIGSGIVYRERLLTGDSGFGAELGHIVVNPQGRSCGCGGRGCAETESSESGIIRTYREIAPGITQISSKEIHRLYLAGDESAGKTFARAGKYLGILLASIVMAFNPGTISIGGGVSACGDAILRPALNEMRTRIHIHAFESTNVTLNPGGNASGIRGAARLAKETES